MGNEEKAPAIARLKVISLREYVLSPEDFKDEKILRAKQNRHLDNESAFQEDLKINRLARYHGTYVCYKDGILCGQSKNGDQLRKEVGFELNTCNLSVYEVKTTSYNSPQSFS